MNRPSPHKHSSICLSIHLIFFSLCANHTNATILNAKQCAALNALQRKVHINLSNIYLLLRVLLLLYLNIPCVRVCAHFQVQFQPLLEKYLYACNGKKRDDDADDNEIKICKCLDWVKQTKCVHGAIIHYIVNDFINIKCTLFRSLMQNAFNAHRSPRYIKERQLCKQTKCFP